MRSEQFDKSCQWLDGPNLGTSDRPRGTGPDQRIRSARAAPATGYLDEDSPRWRSSFLQACHQATAPQLTAMGDHIDHIHLQRHGLARRQSADTRKELRIIDLA